MKLKRIDINNYKSIVNQVVNVDGNIIGFVGRNESGKTNILNSIRMFGWDHVPDIKERSKLDNSLPKVNFVFEVDRFDGLEIKSDIIEDDPDSPLLELIDFDSINISEVSILKEIDEEGNKVKNINYEFDLNVEDLSGYFIVERDDVPAGALYVCDGESIEIEKNLIVACDSFEESVAEYFVDLDKSHILASVKDYIDTNIDFYKPQVVFWEYSPSYLIPSEMTYEEFLEGDKPAIVSRPLFNIFKIPKQLKIKNLVDLKRSIKRWEEDASQRKKDAQIINKALNAYIKDIWQDYDQTLEVNLESNGITIHVNDPMSPDKNYCSGQLFPDT